MEIENSELDLEKWVDTERETQSLHFKEHC